MGCVKKMKSNYKSIGVVYRESLRVLKELQALKRLENPSESELERMALLSVRFTELNPNYRFAWVDGKPVIDIWREILKLEKERLNEKYAKRK